MEVADDSHLAVPESIAFVETLQKYAFSDASVATPTRRATRSIDSNLTPPRSTTSARSTPTKMESASRVQKPQSRASASSISSKSRSSSGAVTATKSPTSRSPVPKKRKRSAGYRPPSYYAHLPNYLVDNLAPNLITLFIGVNPSLRTAATGHAYSHPSNLFWKLVHSSGCTPRLCHPSEDRTLPSLFALGHTDIVLRPTRDASELSAEEMEAGVAILEQKCRQWRPESVCFTGKGIWETVWKVWKGKALKKAEFRYGWQDDGHRMGTVRPQNGEEGWAGARVFVATTTSGLAAGMKPWEKEEVWRRLGEWVKQRRKERGIPAAGEVPVTTT